MRENIEQPDALVDVTRSSALGRSSERPTAGSRSARRSGTPRSRSSLVRERYPLLSQAIFFGASGQIRNMATVGGNLMQRTRCCYFYDRRHAAISGSPGSGLRRDRRLQPDARHSGHVGRLHCHPSFGYVRRTGGARRHGPGRRSGGDRTIPLTEFHRLPGDTPHIETDLQAGELITAVELPPLEFARGSRYRKVRDRSSYAFALVSVAAAVETDAA